MGGRSRLVRQFTVAVAVLSQVPSAIAEEYSPRPKSMVVALVLGLDGIPGDGLMYVEKDSHAVGNILLALSGALVGFAGVEKGFDEAFCEDDCSDAEGPSAGALITVGGSALLVSYIWEIAGGISGVNDFNRKLMPDSQKVFDRVRPTLVVTGNGAYAGFRVVF